MNRSKMTERSVHFITRDGIELEGLFHNGDKGKLVICHPHPEFGGDMYNNVVTALVSAAKKCNWASLRFNFRGTGASKGSFSGGHAELADVEAAIHWLYTNANNVGPLLVAGYSFGAVAGLRAAYDMKVVEGLVAVAPPLVMYDLDFLDGAKKPLFFIAGDEDQFCRKHDLLTLNRKLNANLEWIDGADHFFIGHEEELVRRMACILQSMDGAKNA